MKFTYVWFFLALWSLKILISCNFIHNSDFDRNPITDWFLLQNEQKLISTNKNNFSFCYTLKIYVWHTFDIWSSFESLEATAWSESFFVNFFLSYLSLVRVLHEILLRLHKSFSVSIQLYRLQLSPAHFCVTLALIFVVFSILNIQMMYKDLCLF